jgi:hypothetical protein
MITSKHLVTDVTLYESYRKGFSEFYGNEDYVVLALLPPIWNEGSLIYMVKDLELSNPQSGFTSTITTN